MGAGKRAGRARRARIPRKDALRLAAAALPATLASAALLTALVRLAASAVIGG